MTCQLQSSSGFARCSLTSWVDRDVRISDRELSCLVVIRARAGQAGALESRMRARFAADLPKGPGCIRSGALRFAGVGPGEWLAIGEGSREELLPSLQLALGETAAVIDQSDGWCVLRLGGESAREALMKLFPVDLHPRAFTLRDFAVTLASHIDAMIWRAEDSIDGTPTFDVAVPRSYAGSFWHALSRAISP